MVFVKIAHHVVFSPSILLQENWYNTNDFVYGLVCYDLIDIIS